MKKFLLFLCSLTIALSSLAACTDKKEGPTNESSSSSSTEEPAEPQSYTVTLNLDGGAFADATTPSELTVQEGALYSLPTPVRMGYTFGGWKDAAGTSFAIAGIWGSAGGATLTATWTAKTYKITYNLDGGAFADTNTPSELTVTYDQAPPALPTPAKDGYTFTGWTYEGKTLPAVWNFTNDVLLLANWAEIQVQKCTVTFLQDGQSPITKEVVTGGTLASTDIPTPAPKDGYDFAWDRTDFANITENVTVNAVATAKTYTITLNADGGTGAPATTDITFDGNYTLPTPTKVGYSFIGWKNGTADVALSGAWNIASNVTLKAEWKANVYTLKLTVADGKLPSGKGYEVQITYGQSYNLANDYKPTHNDSDEYSFNEWVIKDTTTKFEMNFTCDWDMYDGASFEIEAKWSRNWTDFF